MPPTISRETVLIDRRQPALRWSAVFAGAVTSVGLWILLQLLGVGLGLSAVDVHSVGSLRNAGVGTTAWSLVAPLIAMFVGGIVAGTLAQTADRKLAGAHGLVTWSLTSVAGLWATIALASMIAGGAARGAAIDPLGATDRGARAGMLGALGVSTDDVLGPINQRLALQGKPTISAAQLETALRGVAEDGLARRNFDQELLRDQLMSITGLSHTDAVDVERQLEERWEPRDARPHNVERQVERATLGAVDTVGKALTTVGLSLLFSLVAAVLGAIFAQRRPRAGHGEPHRVTHRTEHGVPPPPEPVTTAAPYPTPMAPGTAIVPPPAAIR